MNDSVEYVQRDLGSDSANEVMEMEATATKPVEIDVSEDDELALFEEPKIFAKTKVAGNTQTSMFSWVNKKTQSTGSKEQKPRVKAQRRVKSTNFTAYCKNEDSPKPCGESRRTTMPDDVITIDDDDKEDVSILMPPEEPKVQLHHKLNIQGIKVEMPVKPYDCQQQVITAIISGCTTKQNCLLESPTGSGKTLALLCGSLAWQSDFRSKFEETQKLEKSLQEAAAASISSSSAKPGCDKTSDNCCEVNEMDLITINDADWSDDDLTDYDPRVNKMVPKIYYGSRTHRQLGQVVRELRKTVYRDRKMTILSSREFSCIQDSDRNKTELCSELLDPTKKIGCPYNNENNKYALGSYTGLAQHGVESPWEIEDLVAAGKSARACPYFAARALMQDAEIIFCPYNYIIDPAIRESLQLDLRGHIIILDEAHNIEDCCREAGSVSLTETLLESIVTDCTTVIGIAAGKKKAEQVGYATMIENYCQSLQKFIASTVMKDQTGGYDAASGEQWTGAELLALFDINKISEKTTNNFIRAAREAISLSNSAREDLRLGVPSSLPTLSADTVRKLETIVTGLNMLTSPKHVVDYRAVVKQLYLGYKRQKSLELICMNPNVIFGPLAEITRSIILASGTLAPTSSFAGELGAKFPFLIQANHVTPQDQICIKCVTTGSKGNSLRGTYQNVNTWDFQDEVGSILRMVCENVPHGVLMFFSSYTSMKTLITRWEANGTMKKISAIKEVFQETRGSVDLPNTMANYRDVIKYTSAGPVDEKNGAVLFAVFRGKVAEGIDFSDNEARAVITVGIPFAVRNDPSVDLKYRYNDANRKRGLLSGNEWYTVQAFRALNQALGRAIRHQNDWGAIILIDERFHEVRYINLLPTWVRSMWIRQASSPAGLSERLQNFVATQKKREEKESVQG